MCICVRGTSFSVWNAEDTKEPCLGPECLRCIPACIRCILQFNLQGPLSPALQPHFPKCPQTTGLWVGPMHVRLIPLLGFSSHSFSCPVSSARDLLESAFSSKSRLSAVSPMEPFLICRHHPVALPVDLTHPALYHRLRLYWSVLCYEYKFYLLSIASSPSRGPMRIFH